MAPSPAAHHFKIFRSLLSDHTLYSLRDPSQFLLIDSCATIHITSERADLRGFRAASRHVELKGIAKGLSIIGYGTLYVQYCDISGQASSLQLDNVGLVAVPAGYPALRLLSPQTLSQTSGVLKSFSTLAEHGELHFDDHIAITPYNSSNNLPTLDVSITSASTSADIAAHVNRLQLPESNLSRNQQQLLTHHKRFGHIDMRRVQDLARYGLVPRNLCQCPIPKCADCLLGKQPRRPKGIHPTMNNKLSPGDMIHCDQLI